MVSGHEPAQQFTGCSSVAFCFRSDRNRAKYRLILRQVGEHELVAVFTGKGPQVRDYRRGATISFDKGIGAKYVELAISDRVSKQQPEFVIREWE